jgi:parvulin-like peptidyl-prolyl isomerase
MFKSFRRHRTVVMVFMAACIAGLLLFGIGGTSLLSSPQDVIVKVNGKKVTQMQFDRIYHQITRQRTETDPKDNQRLLGQALNELIRQEVFYQEAKKYGIEVTDQEMQYQLASIPAFQREGQFDPQTYVRVVSQAFGTTPNEFEKDHKKDVAARKLNQLIASAVQISDRVQSLQLEAMIQNEEDPKRKKELKEKPEEFIQELRNREMNLVYSDWLNQLNSGLKVNIVSDRFQKMLSGQPQ